MGTIKHGVGNSLHRLEEKQRFIGKKRKNKEPSYL